MASPAERAVAARVLRDAAHAPDDIAELLHVSVSQVYRYLEGRAEADPANTAVDDLRALLSDQELDPIGRMNAGIARQLATKLDKAASSNVAQDSMAVPALAKELRAVVAEIMGASTDDKEWLADVFGPVGDAPDPRT